MSVPMSANFVRGEDVGDEVGMDMPSFSTIGPSPSARFYAEIAAEEEAIAAALRDAKETAARNAPRDRPGGENSGDFWPPEGEGRMPECEELGSSSSRVLGGENTYDFEDVEIENDRKDSALVQQWSGEEGVSGNASCPDPSMESALMEVRTVTRVQDLPADPRDAIGTVLEEGESARVPLVVEFLMGNPRGRAAARTFATALTEAHLELSIECQYLPKLPVFSNSDPHAVLYSRPGSDSTWNLIGRTEKLQNSHFPRFVKAFRVDTNPWEESGLFQEFLVRVLARGTFGRLVRLGEAICTLKDVISAPGQCFVSRLQRTADPRKESWLVLSGALCRDQAHVEAPRRVVVCVALAQSARPRAKMNFVVARALNKGRWAPVYRSEDARRPSTEYAPAELRFVDVFGTTGVAMARVEFYQHRSSVDPKLIGFIQLGMRQVEKMEEGCVIQWMGGQGSVAPGNIMLAKKTVEAEEVKLWLSITNE